MLSRPCLALVLLIRLLGAAKAWHPILFQALNYRNGGTSCSRKRRRADVALAAARPAPARPRTLRLVAPPIRRIGANAVDAAAAAEDRRHVSRAATGFQHARLVLEHAAIAGEIPRVPGISVNKLESANYRATPMRFSKTRAFPKPGLFVNGGDGPARFAFDSDA